MATPRLTQKYLKPLSEVQASRHLWCRGWWWGRELTDLGIPETFIDAALVLAMGGVEVILDAVVGAAGEFFGDVGPFVSQLLVEIENLLLLVFVNRSLIDVRIQMIVPSTRIDQLSLTMVGESKYLPLAALLSGAGADFELILKLVGDKRPLFGPVFSHQFHDCIVLLRNTNTWLISNTPLK